MRGIIPPFVLRSIAQNGTPVQKRWATGTLRMDRAVLGLRAGEPAPQRTVTAVTKAGGESTARVRIHDAGHTTTLPGKLVRDDGAPPVKDLATNEAYDGLGATLQLYRDAFDRNSIDDHGLDLLASVHYGVKYDNAYWDGQQMVFGDGDGTLFNRFTIAVEVMGHELSHGLVQYTAALEYRDQPGALNESIADVFGAMVKQHSLDQTADQADWLIGAGLLASGVNGVALRSMKAPGTAFDDPVLGKDLQPAHMDDYVTTQDDSGGVHINSGIPNRAFQLAATAIGGRSWQGAGAVWYAALTDRSLGSTPSFQDFARLTVTKARHIGGAKSANHIADSWNAVGVDAIGASD